MKIDLLDHGHGGSWLNEHRARQRALHKRIARTVHRLISAARAQPAGTTRRTNLNSRPSVRRSRPPP